MKTKGLMILIPAVFAALATAAWLGEVSVDLVWRMYKRSDAITKRHKYGKIST